MLFKNEYAYLSNFYPVLVPFRLRNGVTLDAPSVEHAYQASKALNPSTQMDILHASTPGKAKRMGRNTFLIHEFDRMKLRIMFELVQRKFRHRELKKKLLHLQEPIVEENYWHDHYWGVCICDDCGGVGQNHLGQILTILHNDGKI